MGVSLGIDALASFLPELFSVGSAAASEALPAAADVAGTATSEALPAAADAVPAWALSPPTASLTVTPAYGLGAGAGAPLDLAAPGVGAGAADLASAAPGPAVTAGEGAALGLGALGAGSLLGGVGGRGAGVGSLPSGLPRAGGLPGGTGGGRPIATSPFDGISSAADGLPPNALGFAGSSAPPAGDPTAIVSSGTAGAGPGSLDQGTLDAFAAAQGNQPLSLTAPGATTATATPSGGFGGDFMSWIGKNPGLAASLGIGGLGTLLGGRLGGLLAPKLPYQGQQIAAAGQAGAAAGTLMGEGQGLLGPIQGGPLPPALEQQVTNALNDAINTTKSRYASLGLSGSTMEAQAIAYQQQQAEAMRGTLAAQLAQAGTNLISQANTDLGIENQIYSNLMQNQISQDTALENSIASFAGAAALAASNANRPVVNLRGTA